MSTVSNFWGSQIYGSDFNKKSEINYSDISDDLDRFDEAIIDNYKYSEDPNSNISKATLAYAYMNMFPSLTPSQALASTKSITKSVLGFDMSDESAITAYANNFTNFFKSEINGLRTMVTYLNGFAKGTIDTPEFDEDLKDLDESIRQSGTMERRTDYVSYSGGNALSNVTKGGFVDKMLTSISTTFPSMLQSLVLATPGRIVSAVAKTGKIALSTSKLITAAGRGLNAFAVGMSEAGGYIDEVKDFRYADGTPINRTAVMLGAVGVALANGGLEVAVGKNVESLLDIKVPAQELFKNQARTVAQAFGQTIKYLGIENVKRGLSESLTEVSQEVTPMLARALTLNYYKNHGKSFEEDFHYSPEYINKRVWDVAVSTFLGTTVLGIPADAGKVAYDMMGGNIRWVSDANNYAKQNGTQVNGELVMKNQLRSTTDSSGVKSFVSASDSEANTDSKEINVIKIGDEYVLATKSDVDNIKKAGSAVYANVIKDVKYKTASSSDIDGIIDSLEGLGIKVQKKDGKIAYSDSEELAMKIAEAGKLDGYASTDGGAVLSVRTPAGKFNVDVTNDIEGAENFDSEKFDTENQKLNQQRQFDERVKQSESYTEKQNKASFDKAVDSANASLTEEQIASNKKSRNTISYKISEAYRKASSASGLKSRMVGRASTLVVTKLASLNGLSADEFIKNNMNDEFIVVVDGSEKDSNGNPLFRMENGKYLDNGALKKIGGKYTIFINKDATTTTIAHEFSHVFLDTLKDTKVLAPFMEIDAFRKAYDEGGLSGTGKNSFQELFSEGLEQYMLSGKASSTEIKNVFDSLLSVIKDTFMTLGMGDRLNSRLRNSFSLSDDTAAAFNRIFEERGIPTAEDSSAVQNGNNNEVRHSSFNEDNDIRTQYSSIEDSTETDNFKNWFGDFKNDPEHSSKAVDKDGKPLLLYHGTANGGFDTFNRTNSVDEAIWATPDYNMATGFARFPNGIDEDADEIQLWNKDRKRKQKGVYYLFMNMRNPKVIDFSGYDAYGKYIGDGFFINPDLLTDSQKKESESTPGLYKTRKEAVEALKKSKLSSDMSQEQIEENAQYYIENAREADEKLTKRESINPTVAKAKEEGYDGVIIKNVLENIETGDQIFDGDSYYQDIKKFVADQYVVFDRTNVKSATQNNGTFSPYDSRIQYSTIGDDTIDLLTRNDSNSIMPESHPLYKICNDYKKAVQMNSDHESMNDIYEKTGWFKVDEGYGFDTKTWRYNVHNDKTNFLFNDSGELSEKINRNGSVPWFGFGKEIKFGEIFSNPVLSSIYPFISELKVRVGDLPSNVLSRFSKGDDFYQISNVYNALKYADKIDEEGKFDENGSYTYDDLDIGVILLDLNNIGNSEYSVQGVLAHELQHAIQYASRFDHGASIDDSDIEVAASNIVNNLKDELEIPISMSINKITDDNGNSFIHSLRYQLNNLHFEENGHHDVYDAYMKVVPELKNKKNKNINKVLSYIDSIDGQDLYDNLISDYVDMIINEDEYIRGQEEYIYEHNLGEIEARAATDDVENNSGYSSKIPYANEKRTVNEGIFARGNFLDRRNIYSDTFDNIDFFKNNNDTGNYDVGIQISDEPVEQNIIEDKIDSTVDIVADNYNNNKQLAVFASGNDLLVDLNDFSDDGVQRSSIDDTEEGVSVIDRVENGGYATYEELQKFKGEKWADAEMQIRGLFLHDTFLIDAIKNYMNNTPYGKRSDEGLAKYVERKMKKDNPDFRLSDIAADGGSYQDTFKRIEELLDMQSTADADKTFLQQFRFAYNKEGDSVDMIREVTDHNAQTRENLISLSRQLMDLNLFQDKFMYLTNLMNLAIEGEKRTESRFNRALTEVRKNVTEIRHVLMQAEGNSAGIEAESMIDEQEIPNMSKKAGYKYKGYTEMNVPSMLASGVYSPSASQVLREGVKNSDLIDRALSKITSDEKDAGEYEDMILGNEKKIDKLSHELDAAKAAYAGLELKDTNEALEYQNRITRLEVEIDKTKQKHAKYKQMIKDKKALEEKIASLGRHASSTKYAAHKKVIQKIISAFSKGRGADLSDILSINDDTVGEDGTIMKGPIHQFSEYITDDLGYDRLTGIANSIIVDGKVNINFKHMNMSQLKRIDEALSLVSEIGNLQRESDIEEVTGRAAKDATAVKADMLNVSPASADEEAKKLISKRARGANDDDKNYAQKGNIDEGKKTGGLKRTLNNLIETPRRILYSMSPKLYEIVFGDAKGHIGVDNCTEAEMKETTRRTNAFIDELARATGLPRKKFERRMFINEFFGKKFTVGSEPIDSIIPGMKISNFSKTDKDGKQKYNGKSTGDKALDILVRHYINDGDTGTTGHEYTVQKMIGIYLYSKQTDGINKLLSTFGNNISPTSIAWVIKKFSTPEFSQYKAIADYIQKDSNSKYNQISALKLKVDNIVMNPVENYFELAGAGSVSDYDLGKEYNPDGVNQKFRVTQGMTMDRTNTVYTLDLNAINTYMSSIKKQEHYIAFKEFSARMKSMMKGKGQLYSFISTQYGTKRADMVDSFISSVLHSSSLYGADDEMRKGISILRNNMIAAKLSSPTVVLKQLPAIFLGMSKYSPAKILQALFTNPTVLKNKVYGLSSTMENNSRSELASYYSYLANDPSTSKLSNTVKTVSEYSLKAMEFFDKHIKNAMWSVAFDDNIAKGMSELEASMKATEWVSETQTSSFTKDNAMMYNSKDSVVKSLLLFTSQMNKQFNMVAYDAMSMFGKGDTKAAVFNFMKYSFAVTLSILASAFIGGGALDDDDDKFFDLGELLKNAGIESLSMVPFIGNELQSAVNGFSDNADVALISPIIGRMMNFSRALTSGEADRIAAATEKIVSSFFDVTGLPSAVLDKAWNSYFHGNLWYMLGSDWGNFYEDN